MRMRRETNIPHRCPIHLLPASLARPQRRSSRTRADRLMMRRHPLTRFRIFLASAQMWTPSSLGINWAGIDPPPPPTSPRALFLL
eukprot:1903253-Pyramimonas_sp.AAC.1